MTDTQTLLAELVRFESVTPDDAGCQEFMVNYLQQLGFDCQYYNHGPVSNFFARLGHQRPLLVFAGHTDVVHVGDISKWATNPFELTEQDGMLFGRGTADMKGSLAAMMIMAKQFVKTCPRFDGSLGFLITSGEEGDEFEHGTPHVMAALKKRGIDLDYCIVGEPSSHRRVGDVIKIGRRGSLSAALTLHGKQGHVAYPHLAENPIHTISPALAELATTQWDEGNEHFPPTSMQVTKLQSGGHAGNIIPGDLAMTLNFRFSTEQTAESLQKAVEACFAKHKLQPEIRWQLNGLPFLTGQGKLLEGTINAIRTITGQEPRQSTDGGTSDGRFIAPYGVEVIELGPVNQTIHQVNECVAASDLETLTTLYLSISKQILVS
ncbi:succinyl-diaminopimelate desuccinylase [Legionella spiritensis]|uniref:succinyl-diaminopimelate desuccinylase n=1 Tax=Legionella spiritensis TaxID=452 RepID=UPI000F71E42D|nr:succinyl-diaminopimelate desuccinylase [Legionella spiritensis]VEG89734.1 succinyl-diaminopimelate desuccinylase [Legionella spiritensis]